jgi:crotonobetainyl-CoA:carnitine CoA-transferase CaiB-like acyl-CoA transferase
VRVLDLSRVLAGPFCCQVLADLGADVVKVERPGTGDETRQWGPPFVEGDGPSAYYLSANRGKRSLAVDLSAPAGHALLERLIGRADVLVENFLPATAAKLGLTRQRLHELRPTLVSCSISGYGRTGPLADTPGYDLVIQATSGLMGITGEPDGRPMKVGVAITDVLTGLYAAISVLAGLVAQGRGQAGRAFDLGLLDCTLAGLVNVAQAALVTGERPKRYGNAHPQIVPYEAFATADSHLVLGVGNDGQWQRFCQAAELPELAGDPRFATNPERVRHREALIGLLTPVLASRTLAQWQALLAAADVPHAPVLALDEALGLPQIAARRMVVETELAEGRRAALVGNPIHWEGRPERPAAPPPELGQHTSEVLGEWLGLSAAEIAALRSGGVVAGR